MVLVGAEGCTHTPVHLHEPRGCLRLSGGDPVGFHPGAAECDPTLSLSSPPGLHTVSRAETKDEANAILLCKHSHTHMRELQIPPPRSPTHTHTSGDGSILSRFFFVVVFFFLPPSIQDPLVVSHAHVVRTLH